MASRRVQIVGSTPHADEPFMRLAPLPVAMAQRLASVSLSPVVACEAELQNGVWHVVLHDEKRVIGPKTV